MVEELACVQALIFSAAGRVFLCPRKETIWRSGERFIVLELMLTSLKLVLLKAFYFCANEETLVPKHY